MERKCAQAPWRQFQSQILFLLTKEYRPKTSSVIASERTVTFESCGFVCVSYSTRVVCPTKWWLKIARCKRPLANTVIWSGWFWTFIGPKHLSVVKPNDLFWWFLFFFSWSHGFDIPNAATIVECREFPFNFWVPSAIPRWFLFCYLAKYFSFIDHVSVLL